uniref:Uncharacterized protein n=1 Tax=Arundo donax TaxID=35708 RepID=A0A0A9AC80_ARUDO
MFLNIDHVRLPSFFNLTLFCCTFLLCSCISFYPLYTAITYSLPS